jgi:hypothetical protein
MRDEMMPPVALSRLGPNMALRLQKLGLASFGGAAIMLQGKMARVMRRISHSEIPQLIPIVRPRLKPQLSVGLDLT